MMGHQRLLYYNLDARCDKAYAGGGVLARGSLSHNVKQTSPDYLTPLSLSLEHALSAFYHASKS